MLKNGARSEAEEQATLFEWASYHPELKYMYAIPNGGSRNPREAKNLKRQGVKRGVPDLCLPLPRGVYHGLYIEMKVGRNKTSEFQDDFIQHLRSVGYYVDVCYGFEEARRLITAYMHLENGRGEGIGV